MSWTIQVRWFKAHGDGIREVRQRLSARPLATWRASGRLVCAAVSTDGRLWLRGGLGFEPGGHWRGLVLESGDPRIRDPRPMLRPEAQRSFRWFVRTATGNGGLDARIWHAQQLSLRRLHLGPGWPTVWRRERPEDRLTFSAHPGVEVRPAGGEA